MNKRVFFPFAVFAAFFAVLVPVWAVSREGDQGSPALQVASGDEQAQKLFATNCGSCHTLAAAGTDGIVGPNLDQLLGVVPGQTDRVLSAIQAGVAGRMPAGILQGGQAAEVADYVGRVAGNEPRN